MLPVKKFTYKIYIKIAGITNNISVILLVVTI